MSKVIRCRDAGVDCDFVARGRRKRNCFATPLSTERLSTA